MKKILIMMLMLVYSMTAHAGLITYTVLSGDTGLSYSHLNTSFGTIYDEFDGAIDYENLQDDGIKEEDMADEINPRIRTDEIVGNFTFTGQLPAVPGGGGLTAQTSAGTSYVEGFRVVTDATDKAYTLSKDTWVYIDQNGAFQYVETALGAVAPTTPSNSLLLAKVTTDGTDVTVVTDLRTTAPPGLRVYQDSITGCVISRDVTDVDVINIERGEIEFGSAVTNGLRRNTSTVDIDFSTNGRGGLDTGVTPSPALSEGYYYIYAVADTGAANFEGVASTSSAGVSVVDGERLIGWCYSATASAISSDSFGGYKGLGSGQPNAVRRVGTSAITTSSNGLVGMGDMNLKFYSSGRPCLITFSAPVLADGAGVEAGYALSIDSVGTGVSYEDRLEGASIAQPWTFIHQQTLSTGTHDIDVKWHTTGSNAIRQGGTTNAPHGARILMVQEL